jgi:hypothetical protein
MLPALMSLLPGALSAAGGLFNMFGSSKRAAAPMNAANQYINQIPGQTLPFYQPYMNAGAGALNKLTGEYGGLIDDPMAKYNKFAEGYKESPGYKARLEEAMRAITNAQAAGGMAGSGQHQQFSAEKALDLHNKDFEDYLGHIYDLYGKGLAGEQGIETQGYGANTDYANMLANLKQQQGQMAYEGENAKNTARGQDWSNIFGGLGAAAGGFNSFINKQNEDSRNERYHQDVLRLLGNKGGY